MWKHLNSKFVDLKEKEKEKRGKRREEENKTQQHLPIKSQVSIISYSVFSYHPLTIV
jgi:hypothetical protein